MSLISILGDWAMVTRTGSPVATALSTSIGAGPVVGSRSPSGRSRSGGPTNKGASMTLRLIHWNTSATPQIAVGECVGDVAETVAVLAQDDIDGLTPGQVAIFHNIQKGTEPGTWTD